MGEILKRFREVYPASDTPQIWRAPGRVNLIGEHTDYNLGLVLPMAIDLACFVATLHLEMAGCASSPSGFQEGAQWRVEEITTPRLAGDWDDRVPVVAWQLRTGAASRFGAQKCSMSSTIPLGAGLSSSAALGVAMVLALGGERPASEIAKLAHGAETDFVGVPCGIMDQFASAQGQAGAAILLDCRSLESCPVKASRGPGDRDRELDGEA